MRFHFLFLITVLLLISSCKKEKNAINLKVETQNTEEQVEVQINSKIKVTSLSSEAKKTVETWTEYQNIADFIPQYYKTTTKESLFNSQRLAELTQQLKDTIRIEKFDIPSFRIRLNVLNTIALRLADMDSIPSITNKEIIQENTNITNAFSAVNDKINFIINKEQLELDLKEFDIIFESKDPSKEIENKSLKSFKKNNVKRVKKRIQPLKKKLN